MISLLMLAKVRKKTWYYNIEEMVFSFFNKYFLSVISFFRNFVLVIDFWRGKHTDILNKLLQLL